MTGTTMDTDSIINEMFEIAGHLRNTGEYRMANILEMGTAKLNHLSKVRKKDELDTCDAIIKNLDSSPECVNSIISKIPKLLEAAKTSLLANEPESTKSIFKEKMVTSFLQDKFHKFNIPNDDENVNNDSTSNEDSLIKVDKIHNDDSALSKGIISIGSKSVEFVAEIYPDGTLKILDSDSLMNSNVLDFTIQLTKLINNHSLENLANVPDFILAEYLQDCLLNFSKNINKINKWYSK